MSTPAHKVQRGVLKVTIWRNKSDEGRIWYSCIPSRGYKKDDSPWKETDSLNADDLLPMAKLLSEADSWIANQQRADAKARKEAGPTAA
jgi:hypothetical protein